MIDAMFGPFTGHPAPDHMDSHVFVALITNDAVAIVPSATSHASRYTSPRWLAPFQNAGSGIIREKLAHSLRAESNFLFSGS